MSRGNEWQPTTPEVPCNACGKVGWCRRSRDGQWLICERDDKGGKGIRKVDRNGKEFWVFRLGNPVLSVPLPVDRFSTNTPSWATSDTLNKVYATLLDSLLLEPQHGENLRSCGLPNTEIANRSYHPLATGGRAELAKRLVELFGPDVCAEVPGLYIRKEDGRQWWSLAGSSGLLILVQDADDQIISIMIRSDDPEADSKYSAMSSTRHGGPSSSSLLVRRNEAGSLPGINRVHAPPSGHWPRSSSKA
jgi:hypothetical protein